MISRAPRPTSSFTTLSNKILCDQSLSWAARGLLVYLLSKPDNWQVSTANLINETANSGAPLGRDGVRGLYTQLIKAGYLHRRRVKGEGGVFSNDNYEVTEDPSLMAEEPISKCGSAGLRPRPAFPAPAKPAPAKTPQVKTEKNQVPTEAKTDRSIPRTRNRFDQEASNNVPF